MSEVFISYAHSTARQARGAAAALRALGYSVWLDDDLPAHRAFSREIEQQLKAAKAALVIWSADAIMSDWVLSEANRAREAGKLVQVRIDGEPLPMPFDQIQCADLSGWSGDGEHPAWGKVTASLADLVRGAGGQRLPPDSGRAVVANAEPLLAVLAFDNLSGDPETAYFSDGISEEIQQTVARGADLKVIGRASSFLFRGAEKRAAHVAAELRATHVLDGSVRRSGSRVRISAQLIECGRETTLWSDRYDRDLTDIFALQDEIAASVAAALKTAFAKSPPAAPIDPAVYDLFLQAQANPVHRIDGTSSRLKLLEEVVTREPGFARGWATLAFRTALALRLHGGAAAAGAGLRPDRAAEAAKTALQIDPRMGLAYQALALLEPPAAYGACEALKDKALAAAPNDAGVLANTANFFHGIGRLQEGLSFGRRAYELDPLAPMVTNTLGLLLSTAGRIDEAGALFDGLLERWPGGEIFAGNAIRTAAERGDRARVEQLIHTWSPAAAEDAFLQDAIWYARNLFAPDPESLKRYLQEQRLELARTGTVPLYAPVRLHGLGLPEEAFELIDRASFRQAFEREGPGPGGALYPGVIFSHKNEAFFRDPRFLLFCAKLGLVDYWVETGKWPDCADEVPYDFRAEARRLAGSGGR